ncbi:MAG: hypothetical protein SPG03_02445 [Veillonella caviae]|nr:hypothetical protein [Veillonella caviae]
MFNASVMGMAMLITFAIPVALVTIFDKQMPLFVRKSALFLFFYDVRHCWKSKPWFMVI